MAELDFSRRKGDPVKRDVRWMVAALALSVGLMLAVRLLPAAAPDERPWVEVSGQGVAEGVYRGDSVAEVLAQAGHQSGDTRPVADGDHLWVGPEGVEIRQSDQTLLVHLPLDLNQATAEQLDAIPGISRRVAEAVVTEREARGRFFGHEDLARVRLAQHARDALEAFTEAGDTPRPALDLNRATTGELTLLDGIGPVLAERIVAGRPYTAVDELLQVDGVGEATLARIRDQVQVKP